MVPSAWSRSASCKDTVMKNQLFAKAYDGLTLAVQRAHAKLACSEKKPKKTHDDLIAPTIKPSRPRGRPRGSKDTKPRSKKEILDHVTSHRVPTYPASTEAEASSYQGQHPDMKEPPTSSLTATSLMQIFGESDQGSRSDDWMPLMLQEIVDPCTVPHEYTFDSASAIGADVALRDNGINQTPHPQWASSHEDTTWCASSIACDPPCWTLLLPC